MDDLLRQQLLPGTSQDDKHVVVKLLQLLSDNGINILEDHQEFLHHRPVTQNKPEKSRETENDCQDKSPLSVFYGGQKKNVDILQIAAAYVDTRTPSGDTPLHLSAKNGHEEVVEILLKAGAAVNVQNCVNISPLHLSVRYNHKKVVEILLKAGAAVDVEAMHKRTPLHWSVALGLKEVVEILLKAGAAVEPEDQEKKTPLHMAALIGHKDIVEILLKAAAAINVQNMQKQTPLHVSAKKGHKEVVEILLTFGAASDEQDRNKKTPLHLSAENGHKEVVEILLKSGALVDAESEMKQTPLLLSLINKHDDVAEVLISAGASVYKQDIHGYCPQNYMDGYMRARYSPNSLTLAKTKLCYYKTESVTSTRTYASLTTETEHKETISTTFNPVEGNAPEPMDCSSKKDLTNITQQVKDHWAKFSPKHTEGWETSCSHDVKAAFQAGRIVMPTTINITNKKEITYNCGQLKISHADIVPLRSQVVINQGRTAADGNDVEEDSFSDDAGTIHSEAVYL